MHPDLESYLSGALNDDARQRFEAELARDPGLQAEVEQWRALLPDGRWLAIERRVGEAQARMEQRRRNRRILLLLSSVAFVLAAVAWWWRSATVQPVPTRQDIEKPAVPGTPTRPEQQPAAPLPVQHERIAEDPGKRKQHTPDYYAALAAKAYVQPDFSFRKATTNDAEDPMEQAWRAWEDDNWPKVIELMQPVRAADPSYLRAQWLLGHAFFQEGRFAEAEKRFAVLVRSGLAPWAEECEWFELLSRLGQGKADDARFRQELNRIAGKNGHPFQRQAQLLRSKL